MVGTREGLDAAHARGKVGGRPTVVDAENLRMARDMLPNPENSIASIAKMLGVFRARSTTTSRTCGNCAPAAASRTS